MLIYKVTNKINDKIYIGQTVVALEKRKYQHLYTSNRKNYGYFQKALKKYGKDVFDWKIVHNQINNIDLLNRLEVFYIGYYDSFKNGYNLTLGGGGMSGNKPSKKTRRKQSIARKNKKFSKETRARISKALKGRKHSKEHIKKRANALRGHKPSKKTLIRLSNAHKNPSKETRAKISEALRQRVISEETREKLSSWQRIFSIEQVLEIKKLLAKNIYQRIIAEKFNTHQTTISCIKTGKQYANI